MADSIKFKRGAKAKLPSLNYGEPAFVSDEKELYIGTKTGNVKLTSKSEIEELKQKNTELSSQLEQFVTKDDIINNLTIGGASKALSAEQGKELNLKYDRSRTLQVSKSGKYPTINSALTYALTLTPTKINRVLIQISNGTYNEKITLVDGIDLIGEDKKNTIITYSGTEYRADDTIKCPYDCLIKNLTVIQNASSNTSDLQNYPLHIDGNNTQYELNIENVNAIALGEFCHHAVGIGGGANQQILFKNCEIKSDSKPSLYIHNLQGVNGGMSVVCENTLILGCIVRDKLGSNKFGVLIEDVGNSSYGEVKLNKCEVFSFGGIDIKLRKHTSFTGNRNTMFCSLSQCRYETLDYESDSGTIIDLDRGFFVDGLPKLTKGNPLIYNTTFSTFGRKKAMKSCDVDNSVLVGGVAINYMDYVFCCTEGISEVIVDGGIAIGDFLTTKSNTAAMKGTVGSGNCFAIALESQGSGMSFKKCLLISPR